MMKYNIGEKIKINSIIKEDGEIKDRLNKENIILYQVLVTSGQHKDKLLWFSEDELKKE